MVVVTRVCSEITDLAGANREAQEQLDAALGERRGWLKKQVGVRRALFAQLEQAMNAQDTARVRKLLVRVDATAARNRTEVEDRIVPPGSG
ncbi:hypothetical protein [Streptomyces ipomoeae]|uniref:hypothetical protein n=1 Tax=Streptomyces ipomoeae TaxID=103232 RepID=UPI00114738B6|nr:hypothetical protein [Streptomyces ipomoeae]MDX2936773.1 hypothetical protein [Streptomyces ipomoeae]TQE18645.1 hypothetical protein SipoB123_33015 [Streptomyces ipomoeae]